MYIINSIKGMQFLDLITYPEINIQENSFTFITGESGCGKSTYLKMLNATVVSNDGEIIFQNKKITEIPVLKYRSEVMLVPQEVYLFEGTIRDNFNLYYSFVEKPKLSETDMARFLSICCADLPTSASCGLLSGGEKQRVFLAIYLSCLPKVLLLDEPTAALDERTSNQFFSNLKSFCREQRITVVCVCHNNELVNRFADTVILLGSNKV